MACLAPQQIMPKFLWKHVITHLSYNNIIKLTVNNHFAEVIDSDAGKDSFFNDRPDAIVIVKCGSKRMKYFWKYAQSNYTVCNDIEHMYDIVQRENSIEPFYCKVFIKRGCYHFIRHGYNKGTVFNNAKSDIEITGNNKTDTIIQAYYKPPYTNCYAIFYEGYISIKNITFYGIPHVFEKQAKHYGDDASTLSISNCIFDQSFLSIKYIDKVSISNCKFIESVLWADNYRMEPINYTICNNIFLMLRSNEASIFYICNNSSQSIINITDNIFNNIANVSVLLLSVVLLSTSFNTGTFVFNNNSISNIKSCIKYFDCSKSKIKFRKNVFRNISKLFHNDKTNMVELDSDNTFIDCGTELTKYIKK